MKCFKRKMLPFLLTVALILAIIPTTVSATAGAVVVSTQDELLAAVEAIPEGGSGEITIQDIYMYLNEGLYIENKDVTFNLVNAALVTAADEYGGGQPVIFGFGTNITINADDNSTIEALGHTGCMGVVRVDNSTDWNEATQSFAKDFTVTVNGGQYTCTDTIPEGYEVPDYVFVAAPGTKVILTDVVCNGTVDAIDFAGVGITVPGELTVHSGKFTNDIGAYAADGQYACQHGESYYVRDKEMSDDFRKPLTDGKIIFNYAKPSADDEAVWLIAEDFCCANPDFYFDSESFREDFSKVEIGLYTGTAKEEFHTVDVVWNYDADMLETALTFVEKFPEDKPWFNVSDLELVNYWVYRNADSEVDSLANYSGELKAILGNSNFLYNVEVRGGSDDVFYTERIGSAKLIHDGKVYYATTMIGARAEHAIYVPENTANSKEALMAAAQKRIDDYIGKNVIAITAANETVTEYYNNTIAEFDEEMANAQEIFDREAAKPEEERDWNAYWDAKNTLEYTPGYKQYFIDSFNEGGDLHFLSKATGDFFFDVKIVGTEETYKFVIIKDDNKLSIPSCATVDPNTNVSVSTDAASIPLDTIIEVTKLTAGEEYDRIVKILDVQDNETFDIKLHSHSLDTYITKLDEGKFEVKLPIPEKFKGKDLIVYYVDQNGQPIDYAVTLSGNFAIFTTDHFSIYTLAEKVSQTPEHSQHSGGTASCCSKAICSVCNQPYGEINPDNHSGGTEIRNAKEATVNEKGYTGDTYCKGCNQKIANGKDVPAKGTGTSPLTGDSNTLWLWMALALISGSMLCGTLIRNKKEETV